ncbi:MAG: DUF6152 family protein [Acidobacteriota bacterium]
MHSKLALLAAAVALTIAVPVFAHHSFDAEFDRSKPVTLKGTVTKFEWMNPHVWVYLNVPDAAGKPVKWQCEYGAPNMLKRAGWNREAIKEGDQITIEGSVSKDGSNTCNATSSILADGRRVLAGSSGGDGKAK